MSNTDLGSYLFHQGTNYRAYEYLGCSLLMKDGKYEYKAVRLDDGRWALREMKYSFNRVFDMTDDLYVTGKDNNPSNAI